MIKAIDAHIHLDQYDATLATHMLEELVGSSVQGLVAVSMNQKSCLAVRELQQRFSKQVFAAYGYHPEQDLPDPAELNWMFAWIRQHRDELVAIGEVGLPYYSRRAAEQQGQEFSLQPYCQLLEQFIRLSKEVDKPVVLHAVYEDAEIACDLLEKHRVERAHFHWFKGRSSTIRRMIQNSYMVSVTPDVLYEPEIQSLVTTYPLELLMVETDGPWPFEGPFAGQMTHPRMILDVIGGIAEIKSLSVEETAHVIWENTNRFYQLDRLKS